MLLATIPDQVKDCSCVITNTVKILPNSPCVYYNMGFGTPRHPLEAVVYSLFETGIYQNTVLKRLASIHAVIAIVRYINVYSFLP